MKKNSLLLILLLIIVGINRVNASEYNGKLYEVWHPNSGFSVFAEESSGRMDYNSWMIKSTLDNKTYYCIDPATPLEGAYNGSHSYYYEKSDVINNTTLTEETYKKVSLLAYYGYGYKDEYFDHTDKKWYGITQVMIWRVLRPDLSWTFKESRDSKIDKSLYKSEVDELNKLINDFDLYPSFYLKTIKMLTGTTITISDTNKVLYQYKQVGTNKKVDIKQDKNKLTVYSESNPASFNILFKNISDYSNTIGAFVSSDFQDVIRAGFPPSKYAQLALEVYGGKVTIQKKDKDKEKATSQGEATFSDAVYEVFDKEGNSKGIITTDSNGKGSISLDYGDYKLKEIKAPKGYKLSDKEYFFTISKDNYNIEIDVFDEVIYGKLKIVKTKGNKKESFKEEGASFSIIDKNNNVVANLTTNENGMAIEKLPYGKYTIHQTKGEEGYIYSDDVVVEMYEDKIYEVDLKDLKLSKLLFTKLDDLTKKPIKNTAIEVYNENDIFISLCTTDENGRCEIQNLEIGNYYILEKEAPNNYIIEKERLNFSIEEHGEEIKVVMMNKRKEGFLKIIKQDEKTNKLLKNAIFDIVFMETGKKYKETTDNKGEINKALAVGKYCINEVKAPRGYVSNNKKKCFELKNENEKITVVFKNRRKLIKVPNTGNYNKVLLIGCLLMISGICFFVYEKFN